eukprot:COSAG01_NODE_139_length_24311_cov_75.405873_23_plen_213_part_00
MLNVIASGGARHSNSRQMPQATHAVASSAAMAKEKQQEGQEEEEVHSQPGRAHASAVDPDRTDKPSQLHCNEDGALQEAFTEMHEQVQSSVTLLTQQHEEFAAKLARIEESRGEQDNWQAEFASRLDALDESLRKQVAATGVPCQLTPWSHTVLRQQLLLAALRSKVSRRIGYATIESAGIQVRVMSTGCPWRPLLTLWHVLQRQAVFQPAL